MRRLNFLNYKLSYTAAEIGFYQKLENFERRIK